MEIHPLSHIYRNKKCICLNFFKAFCTIYNYNLAYDIKLFQNNFNLIPCYGIKKHINGSITVEYYIYFYNPYRLNHLIIEKYNYSKINISNYFNLVNPIIYHNELFKNSIIVSFKDTNIEDISFYFLGNTSKCAFISKNKEGAIQNIYGLFEYGDIYNLIIEKYINIILYYVDGNLKYVFYGNKLSNNIGIYLQEISFNKFCDFLENFNYEKKLIDLVKKNYNIHYTFDVSFDINKTSLEIVSTCIFGNVI